MAGEDLACAVRMLAPYPDLQAEARGALLRCSLSAAGHGTSLLCLFLDQTLLPLEELARAAHTLLPALSSISAVLGSSSGRQAALAKGPELWQGMLPPAAAAGLCCQGRLEHAALLAVHHTALHPSFATPEEGVAVLQLWLQAHARVLSSCPEPDWGHCRDLVVPFAAHRVWAALQHDCQQALDIIGQACAGL